MSTNSLPPWANEIPKGSFISYSPTYKVGEYFSRFHKGLFEEANLKYYYYDPTEHGFPKGKQYPVLIFLHGFANSLEGDICINYSGAEFYAKDEYQKVLGGAYILIPLANEYRDTEGNCHGYWNETYIPQIHGLIEYFIKTITSKDVAISKKIIFGHSLGASICFRIVDAYTDYFDALIPIGTSDISDNKTLDRYDQNNIWLFLAVSKHDEYNEYQTKIIPHLPRLKQMKHSYIFTPEWVYNGDKGIASINIGVEIGQHCLINSMHCNLMFDDGTPIYPELPNGILGWLKEVIES
ncbi:hypothetical protein SAMN04487977_11244 [Treponema bryantii]|uniref:Alpha/beta hydrolase family protein n=1 Tax=Treponema bryantii TaxID=163 RepID=A0A1H9JDI1_9SPIR|nr:hypothetical protein [Treponema bryantii]SEQ84848.1 hypothetical protein SAMN04487977_11244 [Treponema bryantii]